jgi:hypothetical protein
MELGKLDRKSKATSKTPRASQTHKPPLSNSKVRKKLVQIRFPKNLCYSLGVTSRLAIN